MPSSNSIRILRRCAWLHAILISIVSVWAACSMRLGNASCNVVTSKKTKNAGGYLVIFIFWVTLFDNTAIEKFLQKIVKTNRQKNL